MLIMVSQDNGICYADTEAKLRGIAVEAIHERQIKKGDLWKIVIPSLLVMAIFIYPFLFPPKRRF